MLRRFINWVKGLFNHKPATNPYEVNWEKAGYKDEAEYRQYLLDSAKLTENNDRLEPNHVYAGGGSLEKLFRYHPGIEEIKKPRPEDPQT